jgi:hypothetical protein
MLIARGGLGPVRLSRLPLLRPLLSHHRIRGNLSTILAGLLALIRIIRATLPRLPWTTLGWSTLLT